MSAIPPAPPPLHIHSTTPLSPSAASSALTSFLSRAAIDPSYRPDSTLSSRGDGPQSNSGGTGNVNLTLFHLERVLKGLNGESLGIGKPEDDGGAKKVVGEDGEEQQDSRPEKDPGWGRPERKGGKKSGTQTVKVRSVPVVQVEGDEEKSATAAAVAAAAAAGDDWMDRDEFEREQDIEQGEVGERDTTVPDVLVSADVKVMAEAGDAMDVDIQEPDQHQGETTAPKPKSAKEKLDRKAEKKQRRKAELRAKEEARAKNI